MQGLILFVTIINSTQYTPPPNRTSRLQHESSGDGAEEQCTGGVLAGAGDGSLLSGSGSGLSGGGPGSSGGLGGGHSSGAGDQGGHGGGLHRALAAGGVLATPAGAVVARASGGLDDGAAGLAGAALGGAGFAVAALGVGLNGELSAVLEDAGAILNDQHTVAGGGLLDALRQRAGNIPFVGLRSGGDALDNGGLVVNAVGAVATAEDEGDGGSLVASSIPGDLVGLALSDGLENVSRIQIYW